jgi:hypothetical protein
LKHTTVNRVSLLVGDLDAELLLNCQCLFLRFLYALGVRTSSIAITTSTVSRLSRPRSLVK